MSRGLAVLVSYQSRYQDSQPIRCSGIQLYYSGWVLTTATLFGANLPENERHILTTSSQDLLHIPTISPDMAEYAQFSVTSSSSDHKNFELIHGEVQQRNNSAARVNSWVENDASLEYVWRCPLVAEAVEDVLPTSSWDLGGSELSGKPDEEDGEDGNIRDLLPVFVVLKIHGTQGDESHLRAALRWCYDRTTDLDRGFMLCIESTPFGSPFFLNSLSAGVMSNQLGPSGCLLLTDARTALGSEGAPLFGISTKNKTLLTGMVLSSLSWWRGEWVGFTLGVALRPVLGHLLCLPPPATGGKISTHHMARLVDEIVVMVRCGAVWGSGVVVDAPSGTVLTCSHVVKKADTERLSVYSNGKVLSSVSLLYRNSNDVPFDLAVLKVTDGSLKRHVSLAADPPRTGENVYVAGFPLVSDRDEPNLRPTVSRGIVSQIQRTHSPSILQTTCCVQSGMSGGPVMRRDALLGIVVCNTHYLDSKAYFPHINMAVPTAAFKKPLLKFLQTSDVRVLQDLECKDEEVQRIWKLKAAPGSKL